MKLSLSFLLLAGFFLASCSDMDEPPQRVRQQRAARYPEQGAAQNPTGQQPFNANAAPSTENAPAQENAPPTAATPSAKVAKGDYPYGIPVPGKPHVVESPFSPGKFIDVEGFPPGTEVKDPYTGKIFRVP
jgi:hypothetical protein